MAQPPSRVEITLPPWLWEFDGRERPRAAVEDRMALVLDLVERNIAEGGGPFAAGVFDDTGRLLAAGVNRVVPDAAPIAHAEIVAIAAAGQIAGTWDLGSTGHLQLVTSTEPCAMCLGAVPWAGVRSVAIGARDADARAVGFDEGDKPADWNDSLNRRGIEVIRDVERERAAALLRRYATDGGRIYNG